MPSRTSRSHTAAAPAAPPLARLLLSLQHLTANLLKFLSPPTYFVTLILLCVRSQPTHCRRENQGGAKWANYAPNTTKSIRKHKEHRERQVVPGITGGTGRHERNPGHDSMSTPRARMLISSWRCRVRGNWAGVGMRQWLQARARDRAGVSMCLLSRAAPRCSALLPTLSAATMVGMDAREPSQRRASMKDHSDGGRRPQPSATTTFGNHNLRRPQPSATTTVSDHDHQRPQLSATMIVSEHAEHRVRPTTSITDGRNTAS